MRKFYQALIIAALFLPVLAYSQPFDCSAAETFEVFHGNEIRTVFSSGGDLFWDLQEAQFQVPYDPDGGPSLVFAGGIWLGGIDETGELKVAAQTFRHSNYFEFTPGPLLEDGTTDAGQCKQWDRIWTVHRNDVLLHLADLGDNGVIDDPQPQIFSWPGKGNVFFSLYNGFDLPNVDKLSAPFYDFNNNELYEPDQGDYPLPEGLEGDVLPEQHSWCVFNDAGHEHELSQGTPLQAEIQLSFYAFDCTDNELLDHTLFASFKVVNRSDVTIDSLYFGQWMDMDIGCHTDDYMGSYPEGSAFFGYNQDNIDGSVDSACTGYNGPIPTYGLNPPAFSVTFLEPAMSSFIHYYSSAVGSFPPHVTGPEQAPDFYYNLKGKWKDGSPIYRYELGYTYDPDADTTTFIFDGDLRDTASWSMYNLDVPFGDRRALGAANLGLLKPGEARSVNISYAYHRKPGLSNIENARSMYKDINRLHEEFSTGFSGYCKTSADFCNDDCVYPGDVNKDGIVNGLDVLVLATNLGEAGPSRNGPLAWQPLYAEDWEAKTIYGINLKHSDCNGDGVIDTLDLNVINNHWGFRNDGYNPGTDVRHGDNFVIDFPDTIPERSSLFFNRSELYLKQYAADRIHGFMYTLNFDTSYFRVEAAVGGPNTDLLDSYYALRYKEAQGHSLVATSLSGTDTKLSDLYLSTDLLPWKSGVEIVDDYEYASFSISDAWVILADGTLIPVPGPKKEVVIEKRDLGVDFRYSDLSELQLYPNPTTGRVYIEGSALPVNSSYRVFNLEGQAVAQGELERNWIDLQLPPGLYLAQIDTGVDLFTRKVTVIR